MVILLLLSLNFTASVDRTEIYAGESFNVNVEVSGENLSDIEEPGVPQMDVVKIVGRSSSHSTQIQVINGKMTKSTIISYQYKMIAGEEGDFTIPPFTIKYKGEEYSTDSITIKVKKAEPGAKSEQRTDRRSRTPSDSRAFIECMVSSESVYPGEGILVTYKLYKRGALADIKLVNLPSYRDVWVEEIFEPGRLDFTGEIVNGVSYDATVIKKDLIFPLDEGEVKLEPMELQVTFGGNVFSIFGETSVISSNERTIKVRDFPSGAPESFIDAVGNYGMHVEMDTSNVRAGTPFKFRVIIKGSGNLLFLTPPGIPEMRRMKVFPPESDEETEVKNGEITGKRIFTYLLTPHESGVIEIPQVEWAYFNTDGREFIEKVAGPFKVKVKPAISEGDTLVAGAEDIAYIMPVREESYKLLPQFFLAWLLIPLLLPIFSALYVWERKRIMGDSDYARTRVIPSELKKGFKKLRDEVDEGRDVRFYEELSRLLLKFIKLRFHTNAFSMRTEELMGELEGKGIDEKNIELMRKLFHKSEKVRFTSYVPERNEMMDDFAKLKEIIRVLR